MTRRVNHPVIKDRGEHTAEAAFGRRFVCYSRLRSLTGYVGATAEAAYASWARNTSAGARHKVLAGFNGRFVRVER